jgi:hypothetical protein
MNQPDFVAGRVNTQLVENMIAEMAEARQQRGSK